MQKDESDVEAISDQLKRSDVLREDNNLYYILTNDVATEDLTAQQLFAPNQGVEIANAYVASRLAPVADTLLQRQSSKTPTQR